MGVHIYLSDPAGVKQIDKPIVKRKTHLLTYLLEDSQTDNSR